MKILITISLIIVTSVTYGQTNYSGCIIYPYGAVSNYTRIYTSSTGTNVPNTSTYNADIRGKPVYNGLGASQPATMSCYRQPSNTSLRECAVQVDPTTYFGGLLAQNYYTCPIDDDYFIYSIFLGALSILYVRKRNLFHIVEDSNS